MPISGSAGAGDFIGPTQDEDDFVVFKLPDGSKLEVFGPSDQDHVHFNTGPVPGFEVDNIEAVRERLEAGGAEFIGSIQRWAPTGEAWSHFRAPDGNIYELTEKARPTQEALRNRS